MNNTSEQLPSVENMFEYISEKCLEEVKERFNADLEQYQEMVEFYQQKVKETQRKLAVIAIEEARRNDKDVR